MKWMQLAATTNWTSKSDPRFLGSMLNNPTKLNPVIPAQRIQDLSRGESHWIAYLWIAGMVVIGSLIIWMLFTGRLFRRHPRPGLPSPKPKGAPTVGGGQDVKRKSGDAMKSKSIVPEPEEGTTGPDEISEQPETNSAEMPDTSGSMETDVGSQAGGSQAGDSQQSPVTEQ